jgi:type II secretory pathway pseudopilin PulG
MNRRRTHPQAAAPAGFTLLELLIVAGVILLIVGAVWPNLLAYMQTSTLRDHSRAVLETIARTRLGAIDHGVAYQFFYEPEGMHYLMLPTSDDPASGESDPSGTVVTIPGEHGQLPEGYKFKTPFGIEAGQVSLSSDALRDIPTANELQGISWASPAVFYPDGSGDDFRFEMENQTGHFVNVSIRGLTGAAALSPVRSRSGR